MKLVGVLICFALVGNVLVTILDEYLQQVIETNVAISQAKEFMPRVIKEIILNHEEYGMQEIAFMLSVSDRIDFKLFRPEDPVEDGLPVRHENINVAPGPDLNPDPTPAINLDSEESVLLDINPDQIPVINIDPEEELIQDRVSVINLDPEEGPSQRQVPNLNLDPSAVLEEVSISENPNFVGITIIDLEEKFLFQRMMRLAILAVTDRPEYERIIETTKKVEEDPTTVHRLNLNQNIDSVLEERRIDPTAVTKKRVICALGLDSSAKARKEMTLEAITSLIRQNDPAFRDLYLMCRLVGAFRSIKYPSAFIISVDILEDDRCALTDLTDENSTVYKFIGDEFWEVDLDTDAQIKPFLSELE